MAKSAVAKKTEDQTHLGRHRVMVSECEPNDWNPNVVEPEDMEKLKRNLKHAIETHGKIPPIILRPHPSSKKFPYQIVDGEHRWMIFKELKQAEIDADIYDLDDEEARIWTENLNYLRGEPDEKKEAAIISELIQKGYTKESLAETLYVDEDSITDLLVAYEENDALKKILDDDKGTSTDKESEDSVDDNVFTELTFKVSLGQAKIIEAELDRISSALKGKNARNRALEYMAVMSSQTDLDDIV